MTKFTFDLTGKVAIVTGAGQGVGREIARTLADHGAKVAVNDFVVERAQSVVAEIEAAGGKAIAVQADVGDPASVAAMAKQIEATLGPVDILVNNAGNAGPDGAMPRVDFWTSDQSEWNRYFHVNLYGPMNCARSFVGGMVERRWGRMVTIVSDAGRAGEQGHEAYSAAKAGAAGFSRALARSLGRYGVTANTISLSNMGREGYEPDAEGAALIKRMLERYVVRRQGRPADVAAVVLLLASDASSWITGQNYPVNGGFTFAL